MIFKKTINKNQIDGSLSFKAYNIFKEYRIFGLLLKKKFIKCEIIENEIEEISTTDKFGREIILKKNMKAVHVSTNESFSIINILKFDDLKGKTIGALPVIQYVDSLKISMTFGIVIPYDERIVNILKMLKPIEQWNFLCRDHCQIKEQNGKHYQTFEVESESAIMQYYKNLN